MKKKIVSLFFCIIMCFSLLPINAFAAKEPVYYQYYDKNKDGSNGYYLASSQVTDYTVIDDSHMPTEWGDGWYVVYGNVTYNSPVRVAAGTVHLILTDGCNLNCTQGIIVSLNFLYSPEPCTLTIYSQSYGDNMGKLNAFGLNGNAGIGSTEEGIGIGCAGDVVVHGGNIYAKSEGYAAAIGGGLGCDGGNVTVYGGKVKAQCNFNGAGIGGGAPNKFGGGNGGKFTIYGGYVVAFGVTGAGIGGGPKGDGGDVYLYGGEVKVSSGEDYDGGLGRGHAIGGGVQAKNNGNITVGLGLSLFDKTTGKRINGGFSPTWWIAAFDRVADADFIITPSYNPETYQAYNPKNGNFEIKQCSDFTYINWDIKNWNNGWYVVDDSGTFEDPIIVTGDVNLIIEDEKTLTAKNGIRVEEGASLSIYSQSDGEKQGKLIASISRDVYEIDDNYAASIGGGDGKNCGSITIHGCDITANEGGGNAAAIGGGSRGNGGTFTLYGGIVHASAHQYGTRAIGAGSGGSDNGKIVLRAGYELLDLDTGEHISRAVGENWIDKFDVKNISFKLVPAEIPEQDPVTYYYYNEDMEQKEGNCAKYRILDQYENILIDGWYVAKGNLNFDQLTAIGDVHLILMDGCNVKVKQGFHVNEGNSLSIYEQADVEGKSSEKGILNASVPYSRDSSYQSAGIGGDNNNNCGKVSIHGGTISATGGNRAAGIGGGYNGNGGNITIYGGNVTAKSTNLAAGIGGGQNGNAGNITINGGTVNATGSINAAGIGGGENGNAGNIIINNGNVIAKALDYGTGIGSGCKANGGTVTINDGVVNAVSTYCGAGIGGDSGTNVDVTINGGTVFAKGGTSLGIYDGAGINARNLIVSDGNINVFGGEDACEGIVADNVVVTPKEGMPISVKIEDDNDLNGSPFKTSTNITKLLRWHTFVQFSTAEPNAMPSGIPGNNPVVMPPGQINKSVKDIDNAINEASQKAAGGQAVETPTVIIDMKQGDDSVATVVPAEILNKIKGQDVNVVFDMGEYSWTINGKEVSASNPEAINLEVIIDSNAVPSDVVNKLADGNPTKQISLTHEGEFGFKAILTLNVGKEYKGKYGNLYWYDSKKGPSFMNSGLIDENGNVSLVFSHASDYVIVISNEDISKKNGINTGDNGMTNLSIYLSILVAGVGAAIAVLIDKKKYSED